jgi:hypothetical protein
VKKTKATLLLVLIFSVGVSAQTKRAPTSSAVEKVQERSVVEVEDVLLRKIGILSGGAIALIVLIVFATRRKSKNADPIELRVTTPVTYARLQLNDRSTIDQVRNCVVANETLRFVLETTGTLHIPVRFKFVRRVENTNDPEGEFDCTVILKKGDALVEFIELPGVEYSWKNRFTGASKVVEKRRSTV